jgi:hypothetical protein
MSSTLATETLDKAYLEYSNITKAKTSKELKLEQENQKLKEAEKVIEFAILNYDSHISELAKKYFDKRS